MRVGAVPTPRRAAHPGRRFQPPYGVRFPERLHGRGAASAVRPRARSPLQWRTVAVNPEYRPQVTSRTGRAPARSKGISLVAHSNPRRSALGSGRRVVATAGLAAAQRRPGLGWSARQRSNCQRGAKADGRLLWRFVAAGRQRPAATECPCPTLRGRDPTVPTRAGDIP